MTVQELIDALQRACADGHANAPVRLMAGWQEEGPLESVRFDEKGHVELGAGEDDDE